MDMDMDMGGYGDCDETEQGIDDTYDYLTGFEIVYHGLEVISRDIMDFLFWIFMVGKLVKVKVITVVNCNSSIWI